LRRAVARLGLPVVDCHCRGRAWAITVCPEEVSLESSSLETVGEDSRIGHADTHLGSGTTILSPRLEMLSVLSKPNWTAMQNMDS